MSSRTIRSPWAVFGITAVGGYITTLDLSIVNVAFAEIAQSYSGASRAGVAWVITAYNILFASLLVAGGRTADRIGRKKVFIGGAIGVRRRLDHVRRGAQPAVADRRSSRAGIRGLLF